MSPQCGTRSSVSPEHIRSAAENFQFRTTVNTTRYYRGIYAVLAPSTNMPTYYGNRYAFAGDYLPKALRFQAVLMALCDHMLKLCERILQTVCGNFTELTTPVHLGTEIN